jgi:hypothetical protein
MTIVIIAIMFTFVIGRHKDFLGRLKV